MAHPPEQSDRTYPQADGMETEAISGQSAPRHRQGLARQQENSDPENRSPKNRSPKNRSPKNNDPQNGDPQNSELLGDVTAPLPVPPATAAKETLADGTASGWRTFIRSFRRGRTTVFQTSPSKVNWAMVDGLLTVGWAIAAAAVTWLNPYPLQRLERQFQVTFFELRGRTPAPADVIILAIDDSSLDANEFYRQDPKTYAALAPIQSWPWERRAYGEVIEKLMAAGALAVAVDVTLASPSSYGAADDAALAAVLQRYPGRVVLAEEYAYGDSDHGESIQHHRPELPFLQAGALGGVINFITEPNGRIHRLGSEAIAQMRAEDPLFNSLLTSGDLTLSPSFAAAALKAAQIDYPTPRGSDIFFYGPDQSFRHVPFWKVLDPAGWESLATSGISFKDKIVLIGGTANILQDLHGVPFGSSFRHRAPMAGVEVQANAIATLWQDRSLYDWSRQAPRLRSAMVLLLVLGASWLMSRSQQLTLRLALAAGLALAWVGFSFGLLVWAGQILPLALPLLAIAGFGGAQVITVGIREQLRKQRLRNMLKSHASVPAVREILSQEGEFRELLREREAEVVGKLLSSRYRVIRLLGTGGFSETYIAQDTQRPGSPPCVVKQLRFTQGKGSKLKLMRRLFHTEAESLEKLGQHDQIPRLLAYFDEEYEFYLVQELILGQSLHTELLRRARLPLAEVLKLLYDLLGVLVFVHSHSIIHRDIKPNNIICRRSDRKHVLIDFGIAKIIAARLEGDSDAQLTVAIGTQGYIPREQIAGRPSFNSDLYALGTTAIECLTGLIPRQFKYDDNGEILWTHRAEQLNPELLEFLQRLVKADASQRYPSAQAALDDLLELPEFQQLHPREGFDLLGSLAQPHWDSGELDEDGQSTAKTILWQREAPSGSPNLGPPES